MADFTLTKTRILEGVWQGVLTRQGDDGSQPALEVRHLDVPVEGLRVTPLEDGPGWTVEVPIQADLISDGVQTFLINDTVSGETLTSFALLAGEALAEDIRAEMELLRAELDMLKRAFRRHCLETMS